MARTQPARSKPCEFTTHTRRNARSVARKRWPYFSRVLAMLRELLPPRYPVIVRTGQEFSTFGGDCTRIADQFRIRIARQLRDRGAVEVLLHEWAHAIAWDAAFDRAIRRGGMTHDEFQRQGHGPKWGVAYSKVYTTFIMEIVPQLQAEDLYASRTRRLKHRARQQQAVAGARGVRA